MICRNCGRAVVHVYGRHSRCARCWKGRILSPAQREERNRRRAKARARRLAKGDWADREPTAEELEECMAQQAANLPDWWKR